MAAELTGESEELARFILQSLSDRIAGREFRHASPDFFGTPRQPSLEADDFSQQALLGAGLGMGDQESGTLDGADLTMGGGVGSGAAGGGGSGTSATRNTSGSLAWGGHANGHIPAEAMVDIGGGHRLEKNASKDWNRMVAAAERDGVHIGVTDSYRDYDAQVDVRKRKGHIVATATPGTSNHGWGRALDIDVNDRATLQWLNQNAGKYGFVNPDWAKKAGKSYEPWHWEYRKQQSQQVPAGHDHQAAPRGTLKPISFPAQRKAI